MQARSELSIGESNTIAAHREAVERVILEMRKQLDEPFSLEKMAKIACLSPFHFDRVFHEMTGIPAVQFLYALRIEPAKRLLLTTSLSVTDVCYDVGYNSIGTFTSRFTQVVGLSPRNFRKLAEKVDNFFLESSFTEAAAILKKVSFGGQSITGRIISPDPIQRLIFVGLFPTLIPQSHPSAGTLIADSESYGIGPVDDGRYNVFAAAFPKGGQPQSYLIPDFASLLVGLGSRAANVLDGRADEAVDITLRSLQITNPPILIALPFLLFKILDQADQ
jgi:AraC-like DNA-binding protein